MSAKFTIGDVNCPVTQYQITKVHDVNSNVDISSVIGSYILIDPNTGIMTITDFIQNKKFDIYVQATASTPTTPSTIWSTLAVSASL